VTLTAEEQLEELSTEIKTFKELKAIIFHQDYVIAQQLMPALNRLPSDIKEATLNQFNHYFRTNKNIISYLWTEGLRQKNLLDTLRENPDVKAIIEQAEQEIEDQQEDDSNEQG